MSVQPAISHHHTTASLAPSPLLIDVLRATTIIVPHITCTHNTLYKGIYFLLPQICVLAQAAKGVVDIVPLPPRLGTKGWRWLLEYSCRQNMVALFITLHLTLYFFFIFLAISGMLSSNNYEKLEV